MRIKVLTHEGQPEFIVPNSLGASEVDVLVKRKYGTQEDGRPHNWVGKV